MKKLLLLSDPNSSHTQKWATGLLSKGYEVSLFSLSKPANTYNNKLLYPFAIFELWKVIKQFKPDIVHAHYASSYGLLGALSRFHPFIISVWGSDVYDFPRRSPFHKALFKYNLRTADKICSTSNTMAAEIKKYSDKDISVVPFGVDLNIFKPFHAPHVFAEGTIVIGTVKQLEETYGIRYLIEAFHLLKMRVKNLPLKLLLVGSGSLAKDLKNMVKDMGIDTDTVFTGFIQPGEIPFYQNMLSISAFPSLSESFGVSVVEAMACEKPVVASNVGGLPEVVEDGVTGIIVPPANAEKLAEVLEKLVLDEALRNRLGKQGRARVEKLYNWENNLSSMISIYEDIA